MSAKNQKKAASSAAQGIHIERLFKRFTAGQRWEHLILFLSVAVLVLTGLPQKYRAAEWSQQILATPERLGMVQGFHYLAAIVLILEVAFHVGRALWLLSRRRLPGDMLPTGQDVRDAGQMVLYLLFLRKTKPAFGKFNFEQKFTYWFIVFNIGIMLVSGLIIWFPEFFTRFLPGSIIPAAKLAHSTEAIVGVVFVVIFHFYHVHIERLNLSIFTGRLSENEMRAYHAKEHERLTGEKSGDAPTGGSQ